jgi:predicted ferric reductase
MSTQVPTRPALPRRDTRVPRIDRQKLYARRARLADLLVIGLWSSSALAVALYFAAPLAIVVGSPAENVTSLGIITGLIGTNFVLVMLVLTARVPVIDAIIGHDRAIAVHRALGKPALYLLLAHGALLLIGYGMSSGINPIAEIGPMLALPDMPLAFVGTALFIAVVVTSLVAVRRKFSYEGWHLVHLLSYFAVAFALPHQLSVGGVLAQGTAQRVYWIALYVFAFGSLAVFRFIEPVVSSLRHRITVSGVTTISPGVTSIHFEGRNLRSLGSMGGQFFIWRFWTRRTWWHSHPISLSSVPTDTSARITIRDLGNGTARISAIPVGTRVWIEGPYGVFSDMARTAPKLAVVAAGIGVTPVRAFLESARFAPGEATILLRASTEDETYLWDEIGEIAAAKGAVLYSMIGGRAHSGPSWMTQKDARRGVTLASIFPKLADSDLYACGPSGWLDELVGDARDHGVPPHRIHAERFDW